MRPGIDLLIVDHRTPGDLRRALESIVAPEGIDVAVWIGLVACDDASRAVARDFIEATDLEAKSVDWVENCGYSRALNLLGSLGTHPVIGCLNADVILTPTAIGELAVAALANEHWGVIGPRQVDRSGRITAGGIFGPPTRPKHRGWKATSGFEDVRDDCTYVAGSALLLRRDVWDELTACVLYQQATKTPQAGPWLDTDHYFSDSFVSRHAQAHGYRAVYLGTTTITHLVGGKRVAERDRADLEHFRQACDLHELDHE